MIGDDDDDDDDGANPAPVDRGLPAKPGPSPATERGFCDDSYLAFEQLYSSASDREKNKQKTRYNKRQNTIDMQDQQAVSCV